ncbi:ATP-dependent zinc metalloprotease FtsH [Saprospiraceae bacterium]|jgi:AFG3 family protein|nr:ATP-dependent zinc metalloprotease FtsH [Saprospiraceae bacterium]MDG1435564.1 ATP-dependent zinc metalloprotease FtsH [Saprospiraceae bacterium]
MENKYQNNQDGKPNNKFNSYWIYGLLALLLLALNFYTLQSSSTKPLEWNTFQKMVQEKDIAKIEVVNQKQAQVFLKPESLEKYTDPAPAVSKFSPNRAHYFFETGPADKFEEKLIRIQEKANIPYENWITVNYGTKENWIPQILSWLLPVFIIIAIWLFILRRMGGGGGGPGSQIFNIGKSKATLFDKNTKVTVTFQDVAGLDEAKEEVMEVVDFLKNPKKYTALGGKIPKGVLLVGPPGTGKTLLAKAVAGEAAVPFFSISGSDFVEMFVGVGASRVRDLFKQAREKAPCIVFIDEIDAIGRARGKGQMQGGNDERENTLNQLLVEMDGFATDKGVILMAATNRPDVLDSALLRPGRFDRQIGIDRPDLKGREAIFKVHLKAIKTGPEIKADVLAEMTPGFAGADIANICNEAALVAARRNKTEIDMDDFNHALDRVIGGLEKKNKIIAPAEKKIIAYHEAGHAICGWFLENASPLVKVTIVPRGIGTLGYAQYLPKEEYITRTDALLDRMCMTFGGRAAERIVFDKISTGAQSDLDQATKMAYSMISVFGMNDKVGNVSFHGMQQNQISKPYSDATATLIDNEVRKMLESQYQRAQDLLKDKRNELEILANELLEKEVLLKSDLEKLIGLRPAEVKAKAEKLAQEEENKNIPFTEEPGTYATDTPDDAPIVE